MTAFELVGTPDICVAPEKPDDQHEGRELLRRLLRTSQAERGRACEKARLRASHRATQLFLPVGER